MARRHSNSNDLNDQEQVGSLAAGEGDGDLGLAVTDVKPQNVVEAQGQSTQAGDVPSSSVKAKTPMDLVKIPEPSAGTSANPYAHYISKAKGELEEFRRKYQILDDIIVEPFKEERLVFLVDYVIFPLIAITEGRVQFPFHPFLRGYLAQYELTPCQLSINSYRIINSTNALLGRTTSDSPRVTCSLCITRGTMPCMTATTLPPTEVRPLGVPSYRHG